MPQSIYVAPSLLAANFANLGDEITCITKAGADLVHLDVMDGHYVPNLTFGPALIKAIRSYTDLPFDVHLMIAPVDSFIEKFAQAGADLITIHPDSGPHLHRSLQCIKSLGKKAGVALNPATPLSDIEHVLDLVDQVLVMTVNPGFGGQQFIENQLAKIQALKTLITQRGHRIDLAVDGGITPKTAKQAITAGANILIAGTSIFSDGPHHYASHIKALKAAAD